MSTTSNRRKNLRRRLFAAQGERCIHCNELMRITVSRELDKPFATFEHIIPLSKGGTWKVSNLALACGKCNYERDNKEIDITPPLQPMLPRTPKKKRKLDF